MPRTRAAHPHPTPPRRLYRRVWAALTVTVLATTAGSTVVATAGPAGAAQPSPSVQAAPTGCDPIGSVNCLLPFPDDFFTVPADTPTGRRVAFPASALPVSSSGVGTDPTQWNRDDGFSPGSDILLHVPGIDLARTGAAPITDIGSSLARNAPIVLMDSRTGQRVPYWAELDANDPNPATQALIIRPAIDFLDGHRYIVALRDLRDSSGREIAANPVFVAYRDRGALATAAETARRPHMESILTDLSDHGVSRHDLYLAWDFTVASAQDLTGRMLHIRDDAFHKLGAAAPSFTVTSVSDFTSAQNPLIARQVQGAFAVPSYLDQPGGPPGSTFNYGPDGLPAQMPGNVQQANFICNIPRSVADTSSPGSPVSPGHPMLYGHGLLGSAAEVNSGPIEAMANEHGFVICGTDWLGLSQADVGTDGAILLDISKFPSLPDRGQQAMLDFLFLGRLMTNRSGFATSPAFQAGLPPRPVIDPEALSYYGNSQGGIIGGALTAVAQDIHRSVLGVPAMNYSTLLNRSVDFAPFLSILNASYPDKLGQQVIFALLQMQWDRAEPDGYAQHMTGDPLPGTPPHQVLMHEAFGDHQVANVATEVEARTIGARVHRPALLTGRSPDEHPFWGIPTLGDHAHGSALVVWDSGTPAPPTTNTPPTLGSDPHGVPRSLAAAREQAAVFLDTGVVMDVCADAPCLAGP